MKAFLAWLDRHKTKLTGAALVALGAIQSNALLIQPVLSPKAYAALMVGAGVVVSVLGFLNSRGPEPPDPTDQAGA